ncbi:hypothetical protein VTL71DRAFT_16229 [Oculimacula yallundae]|uniref:BTB domain-containing protein n=1 Tax=Oculimacula yallundae TaxID=86028 RepID=A0ABR4CFX7_9HELO
MDEPRDNKPCTIVNIAADGDVILVVGPEQVKLRVLSLFLKAASKPFSAMFGPEWKEGYNMLNRDGPVELLLPEDNADALKIICTVIHHQNDKVPQTLAAADILEVATAADKYDCVNALKFASRNWLLRGKKEAGDLMLLTAAAYVFQDAQAFKETTRELILNHDGPYFALSCDKVESAMDWRVFCLLEGQRSSARLKLAEILLAGINDGTEQQAYKLLVPRFERAKIGKKDSDSGRATTNDGSQDTLFSNQFGQLHVEDINEDGLDVLTKDPIILLPETPAKRVQPYKENKSLVSANLSWSSLKTCNSSSIASYGPSRYSNIHRRDVEGQLVVKAEEEIIKLLPCDEDDGPMTSRIWLNLRRNREIISTSNMADDLIFLDTFYALHKNKILGNSYDKKHAVVTLRFAYLRDPRIAPSSQDWESKMSCCLSCCSICTTAGCEAVSSSTMHEDAISKNLKTAFSPGTISISQVFSARILLDMSRILGEECSVRYSRLCQIAANTTEVLGFDQERTAASLDPMERAAQLHAIWVTQDNHNLAVDLGAQMDRAINRNKAVFFKQSLKARSPDPVFFYAHQSIYCGLELAKVWTGFNEVGVGVANVGTVLVTVAHLYNALQEQKLLKGRWGAMDNFIKANIGKLFLGALPTETSQFGSLGLCLGAPPEFLARNRRLEQLLALKFWQRSHRRSPDLLKVSGLASTLRKYPWSQSLSRETPIQRA